jgi:hypothetical protein
MQMNQLPFPASPNPDAGRFVFGKIGSLAIPLNFGEDCGVTIEAEPLVGNNQAYA